MRHSAIYAGTFDPITLGHVDLLKRASQIFDRVILAVVVRSKKTTMFSIDERRDMAKEVIRGMPNARGTLRWLISLPLYRTRIFQTRI